MPFKKIFSEIKPFKRGLAKVLGHLEADVMEVIWEQDSVSVRNVYEQLRLERDIAYTTIMTIMSRLSDKNLLLKEKKGNAYQYYPAISREAFTTLMIGEVLDGLMEEYADVALAHFVKKFEDEDIHKIQELEALIKKQQEKSG